MRTSLPQCCADASATIVIFGASGDLTRRKLAPALHSLACAGLLPPASQVLGVARSYLSDEAFRGRLFEGVVEYARLRPDICERGFFATVPQLWHTWLSRVVRVGDSTTVAPALSALRFSRSTNIPFSQRGWFAALSQKPVRCIIGLEQ